ncbi:MAG: T9SS type A sorting domain-containing protein, partial [bacterium]|nr:T9SS type A sorting domain-containing protein [bacterium]
ALHLDGTMFGTGKYDHIFLAGPNSYNPRSWNDAGNFSLPTGTDRFNFSFSDQGSDWFWIGSDGQGRGRCVFQGFQFHDGWFWIKEPTVVETPAVLQVSAITFNFGLELEELELRITNAGGGKLNWTVAINDNWLTCSPMNGANSATVKIRVNRYRLAPGNYSATFTVNSGAGLGPIRVNMTVPDVSAAAAEKIGADKFELAPNFPNPFNSATVIRYATIKTGHVRLVVYDALWREAAVLVDARENAGEHEVIFNSDLPSGTYFYRLETAGAVQTKKMTLVR